MRSEGSRPTGNKIDRPAVSAWGPSDAAVRKQQHQQRMALRNQGGINWFSGGLGDGLSLTPDFGWSPEAETIELRVTSSHMCGRILNWRIVAKTELSVADLLQAIAKRSLWTSVPLDDGSMVLVEVLHNRLLRTFPPSTRLGRFSSEQRLVVYEIPELPHDVVCGGRQMSLLVACHVRLPRDPSLFFSARESRDEFAELASLPLLFQVLSGVSEAGLYSAAYAGFYRPATAIAFANGGATHAQPSPFRLYTCESGRQFSGGGSFVDPGARGQKAQVEIWGDRGAALLLAEWPVGEETAPWVQQQLLQGPGQPAECDVDIVVGVDIVELCRHVRALRRERDDLAQEVEALRNASVRRSYEVAATAEEGAPSETSVTDDVTMYRSARVEDHLRKLSQRLLLDPNHLCKRLLLQEPPPVETKAKGGRRPASTSGGAAKPYAMALPRVAFPPA
mmetsp:Transcript_47130/g.135798  ORF Transcript_47130/g.135798 Transcript_47130/m.135798 type:complete len:449 (-) Transcript_47130:212-1558(-)